MRSGALGAAAASSRPLDEFIAEAQLKNDLTEWRRGRAVRACIDGRPVIDITANCGVIRGSVNRSLQWYDADHVDVSERVSRRGPDARLYERRERDPFVCFLVVYEAFADVQHLRSYDAHETLRRL